MRLLPGRRQHQHVADEDQRDRQDNRLNGQSLRIDERGHQSQAGKGEIVGGLPDETATEDAQHGDTTPTRDAPTD